MGREREMETERERWGKTEGGEGRLEDTEMEGEMGLNDTQVITQ